MSVRSMLTQRMDVQKIPDTPTRDASGGIVDSAWQDVAVDVPCASVPVSASRMADFAVAGESVTHTVVTLRAGILLGQRLKVTDNLGTLYLRVVTVKSVRRRGGIGTFFEIAGEEIRQS